MNHVYLHSEGSLLWIVRDKDAAAPFEAWSIPRSWASRLTETVEQYPSGAWKITLPPGQLFMGKLGVSFVILDAAQVVEVPKSLDTPKCGREFI